MKKILFAIILLVLFFQANAQKNGQIFYYYKGEKVFYPLSNDRIVVGIEPVRSFEELKKTVALQINVAEDSIIESLPGKQFLVKLGRNVVKDISPIILKLEQLRPVLFARRVFMTAGGKYNSYGSEFIVKLKQGTSLAAMQELVEATGCTVIKKYPFQDDIYILAAGKEGNYDALKLANEFYETGLFDYAEPDKVVYDAHHSSPSDPLYYLQWAHNNTGSADQYSGSPGIDMKIQQAWNTTMGSPDIKVGVIDEGVDLTHPDLQANLLQGFNGSTMTSNPGDGAPLGSRRAHGTNCAGIIAAVANNGIGVAGVAPNCKIIPATIFSSTGTYLGDAAAAASFDYIRLAGAHVISNSWGGGSVSSTVDAAINRAVTLGRGGKGCVVLFASGNDNAASVSYPADNTQVISVGGINMCNQRKAAATCDGETWWGANYGAGLDVVAPCVKIASTDIQGAGGYNTASGTAGNYYNTFNGTSSACPNAAGVTALVLSVDSNLTVAEVTQVLELSCDKMAGYSYASSSDPNQSNGSWNSETGHGSINANSAVQLASTGNFCAVQIQSNGTFICNSSISLSVVTVDTAASYTWKKDGNTVGSGTTFNAIVSGVYEAVTSKGTCTASSNIINITSSVNIAPTASADSVCPGGNVNLNANASVVTAMYCIPSYSVGTQEGDYISQVSIQTTTLNNLSGAAPAPYYTLFSPTTTTTATIAASTSYSVTVKGGTYENCYIRAWIDYNRDGIFSAAESLGISPNVGSLSTGSIPFSIPASALNGATRLRLRSSDTSPGPDSTGSCGNTNSSYGETEDYIITISNASDPLTYLWTENGGSTLTSNNISQVTGANILNTTAYTVTASKPDGCSATASVVVNIKAIAKIDSIVASNNPVCTNSLATLTAIGVEESNLIITWWTGMNGTGTKLGTGSTLTNVGAGTYFARVAAECGSPVEKSIVIEQVEPNTWLGTNSTNWHEPGNWSCNTVPAAGANVTIPSSTIPPGISADIVVGDLLLQNTLTLNGRILTVNGVITGVGTITGSATSDIVINGNAGVLNFTSGSAILRSLTINPGAAAIVDNSLIIAGHD
jgi:subtilisin family serine protease